MAHPVNHTPANSTSTRFYAAILLFSLTLGKFAAPLEAAAAAPVVTAPKSWETTLQAMHEAYARQDVRALDRLRASESSLLSGHPLEAYAHYWWLSAHLATDPAFEQEQVLRFLARNQDTPLADVLRKEWLKQLGKARAWDLFTQQYVRFSGDDQEVTCYAWLERLDREDRETLSEAKALWNSGKATPEACDAVFGALLAAKRLNATEAWARVRKLLESGNIAEVKRVDSAMPELINLPEKMLALIHADAGRYLVRERLNVKSRASVELALFAMQRLARRDAPEAADWLVSRGGALSDGDKQYAWARIAYFAAEQHEPRALEWYANAQGQSLSATQAAWRARAALRMRDWAALKSAIEALPESEQREPAWRYWLARVHVAQKKQAEADAIYRGLSKEMHFYGLLAAEELGTLAPPEWNAWNPSRGEVDAVLARPAMQRAFLLYKAGLPNEALKEWWWGVRGMDDRELLAASQAAAELDVPDRAIRAAERTVVLHDFTRRYPLLYRDLLSTTAGRNQLDEAWVYGLIKQESAFVSDARSHAGAVGLMQLMPATAKSMAHKVSLKNFHTARLAEVETNLTLGTGYLRHILDDLGSRVLATAAYNAGPGRARRWRAETPLDGAIYIETIPFDETRDYVKKVMANFYIYASRIGAPQQSLKELLGTVPARSDGILNLGSAQRARLQ
jgi:soluble lytic murein transglycosylase